MRGFRGSSSGIIGCADMTKQANYGVSSLPKWSETSHAVQVQCAATVQSSAVQCATNCAVQSGTELHKNRKTQWMQCGARVDAVDAVTAV